ncbi:globin domain-containing protein [Pilimelia columellifera]|uniref:nitric oxide dioxygenase n=1 Tax=Pilimelia columellifera subsp. columellifera TaxID=706583 RepID=A0ABN3NTC0_9ACTN
MSDLARLLKESWTLVEDRQDKLAGYFYARLFLSHPKLRDMFPVHMDVQRSRLLAAVVRAVQTLEDPDQFDAYLRGLGRDHRKFGVVKEHFDAVGAALVGALREFAGENWCWEYEQAWQDAYTVIAGKMQAAAETDTNPPFWRAKVVRHERVGQDIAVFTVRPEAPISYRPGQYVSVESGHRPRLWRPYSIANAPREDHTLDFHVRAVNSGWVSGALVRKLAVGDELRLAAPMGMMALDRRSARDIVCVAGGTGLAPIRALVDELIRYNRTRWVHVFVGARTRDDLYLLDDLRLLASRYPWLSVIPACSDDPEFGGETGLVDEVVARYGPWAEHDFFVSGSPNMVRSTIRTLTELRVPSTRIRYDAFGDL